MKDYLRAWAAAAIMGLGAACILGSGSCAEGDDDPPGRIVDLNYFFSADALVWNGTVSVGSTAGPADTRLLAWTAPGDDNYEGEASLYDLRFITASQLKGWGLTDGAAAILRLWERANQVIEEPYPAEAGGLEQLLLPRIDPGETVWFALRVFDEIGQDSGISNVVGPVRVQRLLIPVRPGAGRTALDFSSSLAAAGDVNLDGYLDLVLGSPGEGKVSVVLGAGTRTLINYRTNAQGLKVISAVRELTPAMTITGNTADEFGAAVTGLLRLNSDNAHDVVAGAPGYDAGILTDAGAVYIYFGRQTLSSVPASLIDVVITGESQDGRFGAAVSPGFDLDLDRTDEVLVGAPGADGVGAVYVFRGSGLASGSASSAAVVIKGEGANDGFGSVVSSISDVNGDAIADIAIGAPFHDEMGQVDAGAVYVFYGGDAGVIGFKSLGPGRKVIDLSLVKADVTIRGSSMNGKFGKAIAPGHDLSGDRDLVFDFAVSGENRVYVFFGGPNSSVPFTPSGSSVESSDTNASAILSGATGEEFGAAIAGTGDLNWDGVSDLVVGAPGANECYVFRGPIVSGMAFKDTILGPVAGSRFGATLSGPGDVTLDGFADLLIGAPAGGEAYFSF